MSISFRAWCEEREREGERGERGRERGREGGRICVSVCVVCDLPTHRSLQVRTMSFQPSSLKSRTTGGAMG